MKQKGWKKRSCKMRMCGNSYLVSICPAKVLCFVHALTATSIISVSYTRILVWCKKTLLNLLLHNYFHYNLYDQAGKIMSEAPQFEAHSNQYIIMNCFYYKAICLLHFLGLHVGYSSDFCGRPSYISATIILKF